MIRQDLLEILVCPESHQPVRELTPEELEKLNSAIRQGKLKNRAGNDVTRPLDGGLVRQDGKFVYPVIDHLPVMLIDEAIGWDGGGVSTVD